MENNIYHGIFTTSNNKDTNPLHLIPFVDVNSIDVNACAGLPYFRAPAQYLQMHIYVYMYVWAKDRDEEEEVGITVSEDYSIPSWFLYEMM